MNGKSHGPSMESAPRRSGRSAAGFTVIDLIVGVLILAVSLVLLASLVGGFFRTGTPYTVHTLSQRPNLADGAERYREEHQGYYPGQQYAGRIGSGSDKYTGSQVLAACLFGYEDEGNLGSPFHKIDLDHPDATGKYAAYKDEFLTTLNGRKNVLSDLFPPGKEMAFCYYVWRRAPTPDSPEGRFVEADNDAHTEGHEADDFGEFITGERLNRPQHKFRFLLIAPAGDRKYFSDDDIKNW